MTEENVLVVQKIHE